MDSFRPHLAKVAGGLALDRAEARAAFDDLLSGEVTPVQAGAFLTALKVRGETVEEIVGAAEAMRARMTRVAAPASAIDVVGTGGDHSGSVVLNAGAALVVAGAAEALADGVARAQDAVDSGAARATLARLVRASNDHSNGQEGR
ncbi:hypothetical protein MOF8_13010 [Methylobacterium oryzae]|uniref:hypothetical protein n=1 Tax=Methylobacterium oryzae TaxID=334852 RepID=UPI002F2BE457